MESASAGAPEEGELELIARFARRPLTAEEVYVFPVVLCDNEVDRDGDRFTAEALEKLAKLFVGKTGIMDHDPKSSGQLARVISCRVEPVPGRRTAAGEAYRRLTARAYLPRTQKNESFLLELESGIKKEVSVSCAVGRVRCSVCGGDPRREPCGHRKGQVYGGKVCHHLLEDPQDAYEWSFVAVPAQREAGVIKAFAAQEYATRKEEDMVEAIVKSLNGGGAVSLSAEEAQKLARYVEKLEGEAQDGRAYRAELCGEVKRLSALAQPEVPQEVFAKVAERMELAELTAFQKAFAARVQGLTGAPQLWSKKEARQEDHNADYRI
jgi:hypothetical protein